MHDTLNEMMETCLNHVNGVDPDCLQLKRGQRHYSLMGHVVAAVVADEVSMPPN